MPPASRSQARRREAPGGGRKNPTKVPTIFVRGMKLKCGGEDTGSHTAALRAGTGGSSWCARYRTRPLGAPPDPSCRARVRWCQGVPIVRPHAPHSPLTYPRHLCTWYLHPLAGAGRAQRGGGATRPNPNEGAPGGATGVPGSNSPRLRGLQGSASFPSTTTKLTKKPFRGFTAYVRPPLRVVPPPPCTRPPGLLLGRPAALFLMLDPRCPSEPRPPGARAPSACACWVWTSEARARGSP